METTELRNADTVRDFIAAFWDGDDADVADRFLTTTYIDHAYTPANIAGLKNQHREFMAGGVFRTKSRHRRHRGGRRQGVGPCHLCAAVNEVDRFGAVRPPMGRVEVTVYRTYRLAGGKIAEHWALLDTSSLPRQLGAQPSPENACKR